MAAPKAMVNQCGLHHTSDHVTDDVECFHEDEELMAYIGGCDKNPGHRNMTKMSHLGLETLPKRIRDESVLKTVKLCANLVVRIIVAFTSSNRPESDPYYQLVGKKIRRTASGYVRSVSFRSPCPAAPACSYCSSSPDNICGEIDIITNKHVVYDDLEAASTTVELFYDSFNRSKVKVLQGQHLKNSSEFLDVSHMTCISHDPDLIRLLISQKKQVTESLANIPSHISGSGVCVAITHPHGLPKVVSTGDIIELDAAEYDLSDTIWTWPSDDATSEKRQKRSANHKERLRGPESDGQSNGNNQSPTTGRTNAKPAEGRPTSKRPESRDLVNNNLKPGDNVNKKIRSLSLSPTPGGDKHKLSSRKDGPNDTPSSFSSPPHSLVEDSEGRRLLCRHVSRYTTPTCRGSSGGPVFLQFGSSVERLFCFVHSRFDKQRRMNLSRRKNIF